MSTTITEIACDLNESVNNRYDLVLEVSNMAKRLLDEANEAKLQDPFSTTTTSTSSEKVICQALIMKSAMMDGDQDRLIG